VLYGRKERQKKLDKGEAFHYNLINGSDKEVMGNPAIALLAAFVVYFKERGCSLW